MSVWMGVITLMIVSHAVSNIVSVLTPTVLDLGMRSVDEFNEDKSVFCFVMTVQAGGTGLNLTG